MKYRVSAGVLARTFDLLRTCGAGRRECYALWVSPWARSSDITEVVHPRHRAHYGGFSVDSDWLSAFWRELADRECGVRVQIHTHPGEAFHSEVDDAFPIVHSVGFLSLVIPDFGLGDLGFDRAFLAELDAQGRWQPVSVGARLEVVR